jgi:hypothetical protein
MAIQPINIVLITVKSAMSPNTRNPVTIITNPRRTQTQKGGLDEPSALKRGLLS